MNERNDIETVINGVAVTEFLITPVTLIFRCPQNRYAKIGLGVLVAQAVQESVVLRRIIDDQHFDLLAVQAFRYAGEHSLDRALRVVGDDKNEKTFVPEVGMG